MASSTRIAASALIALALVWLGLVLGVSFLATPVKFLAPSLTLPAALDVGRQTFAAFSVVEIVAAGAVLVLALASRRRAVVVLAVAAAALVAAQAAWLLPALDARVQTVLDGGTPPESMLHDVYVGVEAVKALLLIGLARAGFRLRFADAAPR